MELSQSLCAKQENIENGKRWTQSVPRPAPNFRKKAWDSPRITQLSLRAGTGVGDLARLIDRPCRGSIHVLLLLPDIQKDSPWVGSHLCCGPHKQLSFPSLHFLTFLVVSIMWHPWSLPSRAVGLGIRAEFAVLPLEPVDWHLLHPAVSLY